jgi:hypothetical protein
MATNPLVLSGALEFVTIDARDLLRQLGHTSTDQIDLHNRVEFQRAYFSAKSSSESGRTDYVTDRSFVDIAAYALCRDAAGFEPKPLAEFVEACRASSSVYDLHVYCPFGIIPFSSDGFRSELQEFHFAVDGMIRELICAWDLHYITLASPDHNERMRRICAAI